MAEANKTSREIARSNSCVFPRDLLQRFISNSAEGEDGEEEEDEDEEIELNLGLSLGGRFGVDKSNKLVRSSSVVVTMPLFRETEPTTKPAETSVGRPRHTGLTRTTSLPAESEEEWRKRKEMQTLRRMAAKRRRSEKLRTGGGSSTKSTEGGDNNNNQGEAAGTSRRRGRPSSGLPRWSATTANKGGLSRQHSAGHDSLQGSLESQGGGGGGGSCSSVSEMETKSHQASSEEARSVPSKQQQQEAIARPNTRLRRLSSVDMNIEPPPPQGKGKNEMPCVFTKGDGPNGKRVDGILYRYGNGEEVRIMCVCHGDFLSPADFVKHAGGPHVDHPLRHIVVNTSSPSNLL